MPERYRPRSSGFVPMFVRPGSDGAADPDSMNPALAEKSDRVHNCPRIPCALATCRRVDASTWRHGVEGLAGLSYRGEAGRVVVARRGWPRIGTAAVPVRCAPRGPARLA